MFLGKEEGELVGIQGVKCFFAAFSQELRAKTTGNLAMVGFSARKEATGRRACRRGCSSAWGRFQSPPRHESVINAMMALGPEGLAVPWCSWRLRHLAWPVSVQKTRQLANRGADFPSSLLASGPEKTSSSRHNPTQCSSDPVRAVDSPRP